jgi:hypothetical protein
MPLKKSISVASLCTLALSGCAHTRGADSDPTAVRAEFGREVRALTAQPTADRLATAAWLALPKEPGEPDIGQALEFIERAEALAPSRPELVWLHLAICEELKCDAEAHIEARMKGLDADNGLLWLWNLKRAQAAESETAITEAINRMSSAPRMTKYENQLEVMMVDALAAAEPFQSLSKRAVEPIAMVAWLSISHLQLITKACRLDQFDQSGRRPACEAIAARMEQSSRTFPQRISLSMQEHWLPADSPQRDVLLAKRRRLDYIMVESLDFGWRRMNRDLAIRIEAARRGEREEDADLEIIKLDGLPPEPPAGWEDPLRPGS